MKKLFITLMASLAIISCGNTAADWEKRYTGAWALEGMAGLDMHTIRTSSNAELADAIDDKLDTDIPFRTIDIRKGFVAQYTESGLLNQGTYTVYDDGTVTMDWEGDHHFTYWMYTRDSYLYMIEFQTDEDGNDLRNQHAFRYYKTKRQY